MMKKIIRSGFLFIFIALITVALAEVALGIFFHIKDRDLEPMTVHDYPYLYYLFDETQDVNRHGLKTSYTPEKAPGKYRIILTGGSVARGKKPQETIAHYLEQELNKRLSSDKIEVINAGVSAFVAEQEFLLTQLILQHYAPDMLVSLSGYNDMLTWKINRMYPSGFELPPHHWSDFRVIQVNRMQKKFRTRLPLIFKNISRAVSFMERSRFEKNYNWTAVPDNTLQGARDSYIQIISDTRDFARAKHISYYHFLQPLRFFGKENSREEKTLSYLYRMMHDATREKNYSFSLADYFERQPAFFTDDCHITPEANQQLAAEIADRIIDEISACVEN